MSRRKTRPVPNSEDYAEKLKNPRWQKKRLQILERDGWMCQRCLDTETTLHVHHRTYVSGREPWDVPDELLVTLCEGCHKEETERRKAYEKQLLEALRYHFFFDDIEELAVAFADMKSDHRGSTISSALSHVISDESSLAILVEAYMDHIGA